MRHGQSDDGAAAEVVPSVARARRSGGDPHPMNSGTHRAIPGRRPGRDGPGPAFPVSDGAVLCDPPTAVIRPP